MVTAIVPTIGMMLEKKGKKDLVKVLPSATIREGMIAARKGNTGSVCVIDENRNLVRLVTDRDFRDAWLNGEYLNAPITTIGTPGDKIRTVDESMSVYDCMAIFGHDMGHAPVKKDGKIFQVITKGDLLFGLHSESLQVSMEMEGRFPKTD